MLKGKLITGIELLGKVSGVMETNPTLITKNIIDNGTYTASDDNADGYSEVNVNVQPPLTTKNITANGTYTASDDNVYGYSEVDVNVIQHIVTAAAPFGYYEDATKYLYIDTYLNKGDTIVFAFTSRSDITLPDGVELIFKSETSWNTYNQYLMFAKYTASENEAHYFEFIQASSWRFLCTYAIFHDVTVVHDNSYLSYFNNDDSRAGYEVPDKNEGDILFWSLGAAIGPGSSSTSAVFNTNPNDIFRVSWPADTNYKYPRLVSFLDVGNGATHRVFSITSTNLVHNGAVIDALQIIPN